MKKILLVIIIFGAVLAGYFLYQQSDKKIAEAVYQCDNGHTISATFYEARVAPTSIPGEPPQPTGSVTVSLDGESVLTLAQTLSASGVRYANADESFVFWNKGNDAIILRDNTMDLSYTNCKEE